MNSDNIAALLHIKNMLSAKSCSLKGLQTDGCKYSVIPKERKKI